MESELMKICKLKGSENWAIWKFQVKIMFISNGIFDIVNGTTAKPIAPTQEEMAENNTLQAKHQTQLAEWVRNDGIAQRCIVTSITNSPMVHIINCSNSKEMWDKLHKVYENKSDTSVHMLQQDWFNYKKDTNDDIETHISKIQDLCCKLKAFGENISDSMLITKIIMTLPEEYNYFVSAWESTNTENRTIDNLTARLIMEDTRRKAQKNYQNVALLTKNLRNVSIDEKEPKSSKYEKNTKRRDVECFNCKKRGHYRKDCWFLEKNKHKRPVNMNTKVNSNVEANENSLIGFEETTLTSSHVRSGNDDTVWLLDSGATSHMSGNLHLFTNIEKFKIPTPVRIGDGRIVYGIGRGHVNILAYNGDVWIEKNIVNVLYVPNLSYNLFSMGSALAKNMTLTSSNLKCSFYKNNEIVAIGERNDSKELFKMKFKIKERIEECNVSENIKDSNDLENDFSLKTCDNKEENNVENKIVYTKKHENKYKPNMLQLWHERFVHQNCERVKKLLSRNKIKINNTDFFCDACVLGKMHIIPFKESNTKTKQVGDIIHSDLCGPMEVDSCGGSRYFLLFKDDYSSYVTLYYLKNKNEVSKCFENFIQKLKNETNRNIKILRTDNGLEFINKEMFDLTQKHGIKHERTVPYTPQQNGKAERENRTLVEAARTILMNSSLSKNLWAEAINTVAYVLNRTRKTNNPDDKIPYELWHRKKCNLLHLRVFGTRVYTHIPKQKRKKWDAKAESGIFVGYDENVKAYKVLMNDSNKIKLHRDVIFVNELEKSNLKLDKNTNEDYLILKFENEVHKRVFDPNENEQILEQHENDLDINIDNNNIENDVISSANDDSFHEIENDIIPNNNNENMIEEVPAAYNLRTRNTIRQPERFGIPIISDNNFDIEDLFLCQTGDPNNFNAAMKSSDSYEWKQAMKDEFDSLLRNNTWKYIETPRNSNIKILKNRWVYSIKNNKENGSKIYKARLVARGDEQRSGIDYFEIFSPVARHDSIRAFLSVAASEKMHLIQFDVKSAFLNGDLNETIYMYQPHGFSNGKNEICKLEKSLYGLKQAAKCWNEKFVKKLELFDLYPTKGDPCIFVSRGSKEKIILTIHVDDGVIACKNKQRIEKLILHLKKNLSLTVCDLNIFLGIEITVMPDRSLFINQKELAKIIVERFNMQNASQVCTPFDSQTKMENFSQGSILNNVPYKEAIGSLMYLSIVSRPDISYSVGVLSRYADKPTQAHWNGVKRIIRYVKGTLDYGIIYGKNNLSTHVQFIAYSDADFAGDQETRRSTSGYAIKLGNDLISWSSKKQKSVALSTTESEFIAACGAVQQLIWLDRLIRELIDYEFDIPILFVDNQSTIKIIKNPQFHCRTKHIDVKYNFIREKYHDKFYAIKYICSKNQQADILTKGLSKVNFQRLRNDIGVISMCFLSGSVMNNIV